MSQFLTIHPNYFIMEGFGTLMGHYAVMYCLHKDTGIIPINIKPNNTNLKQITAMEAFNQFNEPILYHDDVFIQFNDIFQTIETKDFNNYKFKLAQFTNKNYNTISNSILSTDHNICCLWSLRDHLYIKYLDEIKNILYQFKPSIVEIAKNILPQTNKKIIAICVRNEYKKMNYPHIKLSMNYYLEAMKLFDINSTKYLIFSDDIEECKLMFNEHLVNFDISYTEPLQSAIGLCAMSLCDGIINANSSFSYWASLLNKNIDKKIICSTKFIDENRDPSVAELLNYRWYPKDWIALDIE